MHIKYLTFTNWGSLEVALNMAETLVRFGQVNPADIIIEAVDDESHTILNNMGLKYEIGRFEKTIGMEYLNFSRKEGSDYALLMSFKPAIIKKYYEKHKNLLYIDNDVVFFKEVGSELAKCDPTKVYFQNESFTGSPHEMILSKDFDKLKTSSTNEYFCAGFAYYQDNEASRQMIDLACRFDGSVYDDQLFSHKNITKELRDQIVLFDRDKFPNGFWMFVNKSWKQQYAIAGHFNWILGKDSKLKKIIELEKWVFRGFPSRIMTNGRRCKIPAMPVLPTLATSANDTEKLIGNDNSDLCGCKFHDTIYNCFKAANHLKIGRDSNISKINFPTGENLISSNECIYVKLKYFIIALRRGRHEYWPFFKQFVDDNLPHFIKTSNIRWLVCILDSYIDYGDDQESRNALLVVSWIVSEKNKILLNQQSSEDPSVFKQYRSWQILNGPSEILSTERNWNDYIFNYFSRFNRKLNQTPIINQIYKAIFKKMMSVPENIWNQLNILFDKYPDKVKRIYPTDVVPLQRIYCREELGDFIRLYNLKKCLLIGRNDTVINKIMDDVGAENSLQPYDFDRYDIIVVTDSEYLLKERLLDIYNRMKSGAVLVGLINGQLPFEHCWQTMENYPIWYLNKT